jgi:hypothetical protein
MCFVKQVNGTVPKLTELGFLDFSAWKAALLEPSYIQMSTKDIFKTYRCSSK